MNGGKHFGQKNYSTKFLKTGFFFVQLKIIQHIFPYISTFDAF